MKKTIEIDNLTEAQAIAIEDLLATWEYFGNIGTSRWTSFFADGDGNFRPQIKVDGEKAQFAPENLIHKSERDEMYNTNNYKMDFDKIAWRMHDDKKIKE